tara:strand:+ start:1095 stop:1313 length:219 start_codon:yes stop_codon:yes gene_type:complete
MNIPPYLISAIIFLIVQTTTAVWWASSISNDVDMLKSDRDNMAMIIDNLDVLSYRLESLEKMLERVYGPEAI